mgnify:CR=1 FL=1
MSTKENLQHIWRVFVHGILFERLAEEIQSCAPFSKFLYIHLEKVCVFEPFNSFEVIQMMCYYMVCLIFCLKGG